jgi:hypothetical protein
MQHSINSTDSQATNDNEISQSSGPNPQNTTQHQSKMPTRSPSLPEIEQSVETPIKPGSMVLTSEVQGMTYVMLGVMVGEDLDLAQIEIKEYKDAKFFRQLRDEYHAKRGFLRRWLSIWKYNHCDFIKVRCLFI